MIILSKETTESELQRIIFEREEIALSAESKQAIVECYDFLAAFSAEKIIYGINTGFGPMAQWRVDDDCLRALQYNIIRSHSTGAGKPVDIIHVRAAMVSRLCTFLQAGSGVHIDLVQLLVEFINNDIYPMIPEHGSVGASGDLVQLAHIALALIGEGEVWYEGAWRQAADVLRACGLTPFAIHIREGLSVTNGTSMMSGVGFVNLTRSRQLLKWSVAASIMSNEITSSYDDFMSEPLNNMKRHRGQREVAAMMRRWAEGSKMLQKREHHLYDRKHEERVFKKKVQSYYSLRCVPQVLGPVFEEIENAAEVIVNEFNSVCDNPVVDPKTKNVYHGGNFHGDYISYEMDKLKIGITKLAMLSERQINYLFHDRINEILPPFVNLGVLGLNYGLQASQFTATSTAAECQTLSMPMSVHSIPNNNDNQDIVSMGTNSALIASKVIENAYQVMAVEMMAIVQAIDYLKIQSELSEHSLQVYNEIRAFFPVFVEDTPKYKDIENIIAYMKDKTFD
jgi:histidine ammonia-lyase